MGAMKGLLKLLAIVALVAARPAHGHEWYSGLHGKDGQLCCGAQDCEPTVYEERRGDFYFFTREKHWVRIPADRITFLPVPGDESSPDPHRAHLCYRSPTVYDDVRPQNIFPDDAGGQIYLYCAFIPPGSV